MNPLHTATTEIVELIGPTTEGGIVLAAVLAMSAIILLTGVCAWWVFATFDKRNK